MAAPDARDFVAEQFPVKLFELGHKLAVAMFNEGRISRKPRAGFSPATISRLVKVLVIDLFKSRYFISGVC